METTPDIPSDLLAQAESIASREGRVLNRFKDRWVTHDSASRLSSMLGLPYHPEMQDWEHECAGSDRLGELLDLYERGNLSDDDRFGLMALIVSSFDDWLCAGKADEPVIQRLRLLLLTDFNVHEPIVLYWCVLNEPDLDKAFHATPLMRQIWRQHR